MFVNLAVITQIFINAITSLPNDIGGVGMRSLISFFGQPSPPSSLF